MYDKETFSVQDIKEHENDLTNINKQLEGLEAECKKIYDVINIVKGEAYGIVMPVVNILFERLYYP